MNSFALKIFVHLQILIQSVLIFKLFFCYFSNFAIKKKNKKSIRQLKRAWTPDENFFQTLAMNSEQANLIIENDPIFDNEKGDFQAMTYCNFITPTKSFRGHPHIITVEDYERIMAKKALYARKFDSTQDITVMDQIDYQISKRQI